MKIKSFPIENSTLLFKKFKSLLIEQKRDLDKISTSISNYQTILKPLQDLESKQDFFFKLITHINRTDNSKESQKIYIKSLKLLLELRNNIFYNKNLFEKIKEIETSNLDEKKVKNIYLKEFTLYGIELEIKEQLELQRVELKLKTLSNDFSQNVLDSKFNHQDYISIMRNNPNRNEREEAYRIYTQRASKNAKVIENILFLRDKKAKILGFECYAHLSFETKEATIDKVIDFLEDSISKTKLQALKDLEELNNFALKKDAVYPIEPFDILYYQESLKREKFAFDDEMLKVYFEENRVLNALLKFIEQSFQISFHPSVTATWYKSVKVFDIYKDTNLMGRIYFDLHMRKNKKGGAWINNWQSYFIDTQGQTHLPVIFVVCNFSSFDNNDITLLKHSNVVTLFHEMGHALNHLCSISSQHSISGINGTAWDTVEIPSKFLENFAYELELLKSFAIEHKKHLPISNELLINIKKSRYFQTSLEKLYQLERSLFDIKLHQKLYQGDEIQALLDEIREKTSLIKIPTYNKVQNSFGHIFSGGYASGYYGYVWSEHLSNQAFRENKNLSGQVFFREKT